MERHKKLVALTDAFTLASIGYGLRKDGKILGVPQTHFELMLNKLKTVEK